MYIMRLLSPNEVEGFATGSIGTGRNSLSVNTLICLSICLTYFLPVCQSDHTNEETFNDLKRLAE